jgi:hypothetical protein
VQGLHNWKFYSFSTLIYSYFLRLGEVYHDGPYC